MNLKLIGGKRGAVSEDWWRRIGSRYRLRGPALKRRPIAEQACQDCLS